MWIITPDYWQKKKSQEGQGVISAAIWHQKDKVSLSRLVQDSSLQVSQKSNLQIIQNHAHSCVIFLTFCQRRSTIQQVVPNNRVSFISYLLENLFSSWLRKISNYSLEKTNTEIHLTFDRLDCDFHISMQSKNVSRSVVSDSLWRHGL